MEKDPRGIRKNSKMHLKQNLKDMQQRIYNFAHSMGANQQLKNRSRINPVEQRTWKQKGN